MGEVFRALTWLADPDVQNVIFELDCKTIVVGLVYSVSLRLILIFNLSKCRACLSYSKFVVNFVRSQINHIVHKLVRDQDCMVTITSFFYCVSSCIFFIINEMI